MRPQGHTAGDPRCCPDSSLRLANLGTAARSQEVSCEYILDEEAGGGGGFPTPDARATVVVDSIPMRSSGALEPPRWPDNVAMQFPC